MNKNFIKLNINDKEYMEIIFPSKIESICRFDEIIIYLYSAGQKYNLFDNDFIFIAITNLYNLLQKALNNSLYLDKSIEDDIGYLWNEYLQNKNHKFIFQKKDAKNDHEFWVGENYLLWSSSKNIETWLFNKNNSIFLEITPVYKWTFNDPKKNEKFIPYDEWIKNYKPLAIIEIKQEIAKEWLDKSIEIINIIEEYDKNHLDKN